MVTCALNYNRNSWFCCFSFTSVLKEQISRCYGNRHIAAALFYAVCSTSMAFLNKAVINSYMFHFPFFIMACQMLVTLIFLEVLKRLKKVTVPSFNLTQAKLFMLPSLAYALHAALALMALEGLNIPMYTAVKRCTPLVNLGLSVFILHKPLPSVTIALSVLTITVGCIMAVLGDLTFDMFAYIFGGLSVFAQGLYLTLVQKCSENHSSALEILYFNSYITVGLFIFVSVILSEPEEIMKNIYLRDLKFHIIYWTLICMGAMLNYSLFLCTTLNSALTTSMVAVGKSTLQTIIGTFAFGGIRYHPLNVAGIVLNLFGGIMYTFTKYQEILQKGKKYDGFSLSKKLLSLDKDENADKSIDL